MNQGLIERLLSILKIKSFTYQERNLSDFIKKEFSNINNFICYRIGNCLIFEEKFPKNAKKISLYGHLDTVLNQQDLDPYATEEKIFGCGASDMKAGVAVMMELLKIADGKDRNINLQFVFYDGEEGDYHKSGLVQAFQQHLSLEKYKPDFALVLEPTLNKIQTGCLGTMHCELTVRGKSGHSARPWQADNPILKLGKILDKLTKHQPKEVLVQGLPFVESMSITTIEGGSVRNVIPEEVKMNVNYRFSPLQNEKQAEEFLQSFFSFDEISTHLALVDSAPSCKVILENTLLQDFVQKFQLPIMPKQAWTDIARLSLHGIDAVNFGPGDPAQAHQKNEFVLVEDLLKNYQILSQFLL